MFLAIIWSIAYSLPLVIVMDVDPDSALRKKGSFCRSGSYHVKYQGFLKLSAFLTIKTRGMRETYIYVDREKVAKSMYFYSFINMFLPHSLFLFLYICHYLLDHVSHLL